jgi:DNA-directed RNA polymerase subunit RPC12/RpoP
MSHGTTETVECPECGEAFDPTAAGGWCTNSDCGEYHYEGDRPETAADGGGEAAAEPVDDDGGDADTESGAANGDDGEDDGADDEETLACPDCGTEVADDDNFCRSCGADVSHLSPGGELAACPDCGGDIEPEDSFCRNCGENLDAHRGSGDDGETIERAGGPARAGTATETGPDEPYIVLVVRNREIQVTDGDTVGREVRSVIMDTGGDEEDAVRVHREHVKFEREDDQFHLIDLGQNPTVVNGDALDQGDQVPVSPGDRIELSNVAKIRVQDA